MLVNMRKLSLLKFRCGCTSTEIFLFLPWLARLVGLPNGRVAADGSPGRMDDRRVVRNFKLEPTARGIQSRKAILRVVYWFEREGFLVLTGMTRPVLGESCTTPLKGFAIFPRYQKTKNKKNRFVTLDETWNHHYIPESREGSK